MTEHSRAQRYAEAMGTPLPQPTGKRIRRIEAVMAVADAEINQVQDEAEGWAKSSGEAFSAWHEALARAEKAEAKVARVEALRAHIADPKNRASSPASKRGQIVDDVIADVLGEIDAALRGDSLHGPDCVDCRNGITEFHRSRTDKPNRLREDGGA